ncbi:MAG: dihydroorotate dehydrogenase [Clostridia bacterium]|nr:dihydroorotate dehydrogenase [Clostridia bacterium]
MRSDLTTALGPLTLANPVVLASGTCGFGLELVPYLDLKRLGALTVKSLTVEPWPGNPPPRLAETPAGLLNAIGLENPGVSYFLEEIWPVLRRQGVPVIASVAGRTPQEYAAVAERLGEAEGLAALEVNISCPNVREGGALFGSRPETAAAVVAAVRRRTRLPLLVKLAPMVTDLVAVARAAVEAGADALSLVNTLPGMAIDLTRRRPYLGNVVGGLSGPAIKPVALRLVWEVAGALPGVPLLGMGGISSAADALEFILAGARAVGIGTATLINPGAALAVLEGLENYCRQNGITRLAELVGAARGGA